MRQQPARHVASLPMTMPGEGAGPTAARRGAWHSRRCGLLPLRIALALLALLLPSRAGSLPGDGEDATLVRFVRPSARDFVEVVRGGEGASEVLLALRDDFAVPADGYLAVTGFAAGEEDPTVLCPNSVRSLDDCERDAAKQLEGTFRLTLFGVELGPQEVCVAAYDWDSVLLAEACQTLVGSDRFPGLHDSLLYYEDHADEFVGPDALHLLWTRIGALQGGAEPFALLSLGDRSAGALQRRFFLEGGDSAGGANTTAARAILVCVGADCEGSEHGAVFDVARDGRRQRLATLSAAAPLDAVWAEHGSSGGAMLRALEVAASVPAPDEAVAGLAETLKTTEPVVILSQSSARARTRLAPTVAALSRLGYHTFMAGTERLLMLHGEMWHPAWARPLTEAAEEEMTFVAVKATGALYRPLLALYNASGMVIGCAPYRMSSFHTPDGMYVCMYYVCVWVYLCVYVCIIYVWLRALSYVFVPHP